mgnify:CR=1 FL=1
MKIDEKLTWLGAGYDNTWKGIHVCGDPSFADWINHQIDFILPHQEACVKVSIGSNLDEPADNESWGLGNIALYSCVHCDKPRCPPSTCPASTCHQNAISESE